MIVFFLLTASGWQKQEFFDQIPGFSALSTRNSTSGLSLENLSSSTGLSSSKSSRICLPRVRYFEDSPQSLFESTSSDFGLSLPFFDKKNPTRFLDIVKGVSARVNENAGVGRKDGPGSAEMTRKFGKKRPRTASFGSLSEPKRGRLGPSSSTTKNVSINGDKGKGRDKAPYQNGDASSDSRSLQGHQSMPNVFLPQDVFPKSAEHRGHGVLKHADDSEGQGSLPTPSQTKMPPPPAPLRQPPCFKHNSAHLSSSSIDKQTPTAAKNLDPPKSDPTPKLHPLLLPKSSSTPYSRSKSHSSKAPVGHQLRTNSFPHEKGKLVLSQANILVTAAATPAPLTSNPSTAGKLSSRPPVLGMRRTHTYPCRSSNNQNLPTKQKGFKPPLMSSSQPQALSQQSQEKGSIVETEPIISAAFRKHSGNKMESLASQATTCSNGSISSESFRSTPSIHTSSTSLFDSPVPSAEHAADIHEVAVAPASASSPLSASINGDSDSSFGDTSFDLDALEETMRMYD